VRPGSSSSVPGMLCKCMRLHFAGPHAPHWVKGVLVDCVGNVVWR
jgi:hypothetical protein